MYGIECDAFITLSMLIRAWMVNTYTLAHIYQQHPSTINCIMIHDHKFIIRCEKCVKRDGLYCSKMWHIHLHFSRTPWHRANGLADGGQDGNERAGGRRGVASLSIRVRNRLFICMLVCLCALLYLPGKMQSHRYTYNAHSGLTIRLNGWMASSRFFSDSCEIPSRNFPRSIF